MNLVLGGIALATALFFFGGFGWIGCRVAGAEITRVTFLGWNLDLFQWMIVGGAFITFASLMVAIVVGVYHLYLYWFTDKKPLSLFATTKKEP